MPSDDVVSAASPQPSVKQRLVDGGPAREGGRGQDGETTNTSETTAVGEAPSSSLSNQR